MSLGDPIPQKWIDAPRIWCTCNEPIALYVPPGKHVDLSECPVHKRGPRRIYGRDITLKDIKDGGIWD